MGDGKGESSPALSPLTGAYLLVILPQTHAKEHLESVLHKLTKGLLSWDTACCHVDLYKELETITSHGPEGELVKHGERLIQFASENLVTEVLIHPQLNTLVQCLRNLLSSFTRHRHIIHAGYTYSGNGSWILQDGTFSFADFHHMFQEIEVQRVLVAYENTVTMDIHCCQEGDWANVKVTKEPFAKLSRLSINPSDKISVNDDIKNFTEYLRPYIISYSLEQLLEPSDVVGNIRFSHPTLYVFPGGQGDAALFGINGFNMLVDGGFSRKTCFWDFTRHLDRLDAALVTRLNNGNIQGITSFLQRKKMNHVYPQIGHFFCNIQDRKHPLSPDGDKDRDPMLINIIDQGQELVTSLHHLNLKPQPCYRDSSMNPINLYHKVGHGKLDMYVLSPAKDSREVKDFVSRWNANDIKLFATINKKSGEFSFPLPNRVSICALLVWQPANPNDNITRLLFPGSTPQHKIMDGLEKIKQLEFLKHPTCSAKSLSPSSSTIGLNVRQNVKLKPHIDKPIQPPVSEIKPAKIPEPLKAPKIDLPDAKVKPHIRTKKVPEKAKEEKIKEKVKEEKEIKEEKAKDEKEKVDKSKEEGKKEEIAEVETAKEKDIVPEKVIESEAEPQQIVEVNGVPRQIEIEIAKEVIPDSLENENIIEEQKVLEKNLENLIDSGKDIKTDIEAKAEIISVEAVKPKKEGKNEKQKTDAVKKSDKLVKKKEHPEKSDKVEKEDKPKRTVARRADKRVPKPPSKTEEKKPESAKSSPTTPKKTPISKPMGEPKTRPLKTRPSPSATPAKSTKEENNRKVVEQRAQKIAKKEEVKKTEKKPLPPRKAPVEPSKEIKKSISPVKAISKAKPRKAPIADKELKPTTAAAPSSQAPPKGKAIKGKKIANNEIKIISDIIKDTDMVNGDASLSKEDDEILIVEKIELELYPEEVPSEEKEALADTGAAEEAEKIEAAGLKEGEAEEIREEVTGIIETATDIVLKAKTPEEVEKAIKERIPIKEAEKELKEKSNEMEQKQQAEESHPDEKFSATVESGATTTAPTLPEDERIPIEEVKEGIEEKHVKEETKEKDQQQRPEQFETKVQEPAVATFDQKAQILRDIVKTPDEVADLPVHEVADYETGEPSRDIVQEEGIRPEETTGDELKFIKDGLEKEDKSKDLKEDLRTSPDTAEGKTIDLKQIESEIILEQKEEAPTANEMGKPVEEKAEKVEDIQPTSAAPLESVTKETIKEEKEKEEVKEDALKEETEKADKEPVKEAAIKPESAEASGVAKEQDELDLQEKKEVGSEDKQTVKETISIQEEEEKEKIVKKDQVVVAEAEKEEEGAKKNIEEEKASVIVEKADVTESELTQDKKPSTTHEEEISKKDESTTAEEEKIAEDIKKPGEIDTKEITQRNASKEPDEETVKQIDEGELAKETHDAVVKEKYVKEHAEDKSVTDKDVDMAEFAQEVEVTGEKDAEQTTSKKAKEVGTDVEEEASKDTISIEKEVKETTKEITDEALIQKTVQEEIKEEEETVQEDTLEESATEVKEEAIIQASAIEETTEEIKEDAPVEKSKIEEIAKEDKKEIVTIKEVKAEALIQESAIEETTEEVKEEAPIQESAVKEIAKEEKKEEIIQENVIKEITEEVKEEAPVQESEIDEEAKKVKESDTAQKSLLEETAEEVTEDRNVQESKTKETTEEVKEEAPVQESVTEETAKEVNEKETVQENKTKEKTEEVKEEAHVEKIVIEEIAKEVKDKETVQESKTKETTEEIKEETSVHVIEETAEEVKEDETVQESAIEETTVELKEASVQKIATEETAKEVKEEETVQESAKKEITEVKEEAPVIESATEVKEEPPVIESAAEVKEEAPVIESATEVKEEAPVQESIIKEDAPVEESIIKETAKDLKAEAPNQEHILEETSKEETEDALVHEVTEQTAKEIKEKESVQVDVPEKTTQEVEHEESAQEEAKEEIDKEVKEEASGEKEEPPKDFKEAEVPEEVEEKESINEIKDEKEAKETLKEDIRKTVEESISETVDEKEVSKEPDEKKSDTPLQQEAAAVIIDTETVEKDVEKEIDEGAIVVEVVLTEEEKDGGIKEKLTDIEKENVLNKIVDTKYSIAEESDEKEAESTKKQDESKGQIEESAEESEKADDKIRSEQESQGGEEREIEHEKKLETENKIEVTHSDIPEKKVAEVTHLAESVTESTEEKIQEQTEKIKVKTIEEPITPEDKTAVKLGELSSEEKLQTDLKIDENDVLEKQDKASEELYKEDKEAMEESKIDTSEILKDYALSESKEPLDSSEKGVISEIDTKKVEKITSTVTDVIANELLKEEKDLPNEELKQVVKEEAKASDDKPDKDDSLAKKEKEKESSDEVTRVITGKEEDKAISEGSIDDTKPTITYKEHLKEATMLDDDADEKEECAKEDARDDSCKDKFEAKDDSQDKLDAGKISKLDEKIGETSKTDFLKDEKIDIAESSSELEKQEDLVGELEITSAKLSLSGAGVQIETTIEGKDASEVEKRPDDKQTTDQQGTTIDEKLELSEKKPTEKPPNEIEIDHPKDREKDITSELINVKEDDKIRREQPEDKGLSTYERQETIDVKEKEDIQKIEETKDESITEIVTADKIHDLESEVVKNEDLPQTEITLKEVAEPSTGMDKKPVSLLKEEIPEKIEESKIIAKNIKSESIAESEIKDQIEEVEDKIEKLESKQPNEDTKNQVKESVEMAKAETQEQPVVEPNISQESSKEIRTRIPHSQLSEEEILKELEQEIIPIKSEKRSCKTEEVHEKKKISHDHHHAKVPVDEKFEAVRLPYTKKDAELSEEEDNAEQVVQQASIPLQIKDKVTDGGTKDGKDKSIISSVIGGIVSTCEKIAIELVDDDEKMHEKLDLTGQKEEKIDQMETKQETQYEAKEKEEMIKETISEMQSATPKEKIPDDYGKDKKDTEEKKMDSSEEETKTTREDISKDEMDTLNNIKDKTDEKKTDLASSTESQIELCKEMEKSKIEQQSKSHHIEAGKDVAPGVEDQPSKEIKKEEKKETETDQIKTVTGKEQSSEDNKVAEDKESSILSDETARADSASVQKSASDLESTDKTSEEKIEMKKDIAQEDKEEQVPKTSEIDFNELPPQQFKGEEIVDESILPELKTLESESGISKNITEETTLSPVSSSSQKQEHKEDLTEKVLSLEEKESHTTLDDLLSITGKISPIAQSEPSEITEQKPLETEESSNKVLSDNEKKDITEEDSVSDQKTVVVEESSKQETISPKIDQTTTDVKLKDDEIIESTFQMNEPVKDENFKEETLSKSEDKIVSSTIVIDEKQQKETDSQKDSAKIVQTESDTKTEVSIVTTQEKDETSKTEEKELAELKLLSPTSTETVQTEPTVKKSKDSEVLKEEEIKEIQKDTLIQDKESIKSVESSPKKHLDTEESTISSSIKTSETAAAPEEIPEKSDKHPSADDKSAQISLSKELDKQEDSNKEPAEMIKEDICSKEVSKDVSSSEILDGDVKSGLKDSFELDVKRKETQSPTKEAEKLDDNKSDIFDTASTSSKPTSKDTKCLDSLIETSAVVEISTKDSKITETESQIEILSKIVSTDESKEIESSSSISQLIESSELQSALFKDIKSTSSVQEQASTLKESSDTTPSEIKDIIQSLGENAGRISETVVECIEETTTSIVETVSDIKEKTSEVVKEEKSSTEVKVEGTMTRKESEMKKIEAKETTTATSSDETIQESSKITKKIEEESKEQTSSNITAETEIKETLSSEQKEETSIKESIKIEEKMSEIQEESKKSSDVKMTESSHLESSTTATDVKVESVTKEEKKESTVRIEDAIQETVTKVETESKSEVVSISDKKEELKERSETLEKSTASSPKEKSKKIEETVFSDITPVTKESEQFVVQLDFGMDAPETPRVEDTPEFKKFDSSTCEDVKHTVSDSRLPTELDSSNSMTDNIKDNDDRLKRIETSAHETVMNQTTLVELSSKESISVISDKEVRLTQNESEVPSQSGSDSQKEDKLKDVIQKHETETLEKTIKESSIVQTNSDKDSSGKSQEKSVKTVTSSFLEMETSKSAEQSKPEVESSTVRIISEKKEGKGDGVSSVIYELRKDVPTRSATPGSDLEMGSATPRSDLSSGQASRSATQWEASEGRQELEHFESDEEIPGSPMSIASHIPSPPNFDYEIRGKDSAMTSSFYGALPDESDKKDTFAAMYISKYDDDSDIDPRTFSPSKVGPFEAKVSSERRDSMNLNGTKDTDKSTPEPRAESSKDPIESWGKPLGLPPPPKSMKNFDWNPIVEWGHPLGLPSPSPPAKESNSDADLDLSNQSPTRRKIEKMNAENERIASNIYSGKETINKILKRSESPVKKAVKGDTKKSSGVSPIYLDLTYVPHHGNSHYADVEFFKKIRARYYVFSGTEPSKEVFNALLEAKQTWEDKDLEVTIIPTYDTDTLAYWVAENEETLTKNKIDLSPSASRCTINLQDHETSCSAYRLEF